jgi:hypothetical protein
MQPLGIVKGFDVLEHAQPGGIQIGIAFVVGPLVLHRSDATGLAQEVSSPPAPCGENATAEELQAEVQRLQKALHRAEMERDILKKATAYFAQESL